MRRLTFGMDDVLADTHHKLVSIVMNEFDPLHDEALFYQKPFRELLHPKQVDRLYRMVSQPGFFADLPVKAGAVETMHKLTKYYDVFIATHAMEFPNSFHEKFTWLRRHFSFVPWTNLVFCGNKSILITDYLIDDQPKTLSLSKSEGILFSSPHNLKTRGYRRVKDWNEIAELFLPHA